MTEQDVSIFTQCLRGYSVAPVGKNVIHPDQVLCELNDVSSCPSNENTFAAETTDIDVSDSLLVSMCGDKTRLQQLKERREQYLNEERELGGSFNIFNNEVPKFTSIPVEDVDLNKTPVQTAGSQGRIGEGCSTPKDIIDHTFGPLRHLDLSEVADITTHLNLPKVLADSTNNDKRPKKISMVPEKRQSETFVLPVVNNEGTFLVPKPIRRISKPADAKKEEVKKTDSLSVKAIANAASQKATDTLKFNLNAETVEKKNNLNVLIKPAKVATIPPANEQKQSETFVLDREETFVIPEKVTTHPVKIGSSAREKREQNRKNQSSLLEDLRMDINSPGRIMFGSRPAKKVRELPPTPVQNRDVNEKNLFGIRDRIGVMTLGSKISKAKERIVDENHDEDLILTVPATGKEDDVQPDVDMGTPKRSTGSQRTNAIQAVVDRLYQSPSRRIREKEISKKPTAAPTPSKDDLLATPTRAQKTPRTELTPNANFMKPTVSSVMRTSINSGKRGADVSRILQESVLRTPTSTECTQIMCERQMNSGVIPRFDTAKIDRTKLERIRLFPNDTRNESFMSTREANLAKSRSKRKSQADVYDNTCSNGTERRNCVPIAENAEESLVDNSMGGVPDCYDDSHVQNANCLPSTPCRAPDAKRLLTDSCCTVNTPSRSGNKLNFDDDDDDNDDHDNNNDDSNVSSGRGNKMSHSARFDNDGSTVNDELFERLSVTDDEDRIVSIGRVLKRKKVEIVLKPREIIKPVIDEDSVGLRRSTRNRMKPTRDWLGEKPVYAFSPSGGRKLVGSTSVVIHDPTLLKARSLDINVITDQQIRENARKRKERERRRAEAKLRKARKVKQLRALHRKGENLDITVDSIVTSSDEDSE
ncbi:unnamed protein product [Auanema sp. JU1783]|nr:unnamed protein product [Auanema sp. JU1783]